MLKPQDQLRTANFELSGIARRALDAAVYIDQLERENAEWREWCTKVAHAVGFAEGCEGIGDDAAIASRQIGSQSIRRAILGRLHERNAERNAAIAAAGRNAAESI